jgi:hypothetical protein
MKLADFIKQLQQFDQDAEILVSSDEELNTLYTDIGVSYLGEDNDTSKVVVWGNTGSELDEGDLNE